MKTDGYVNFLAVHINVLKFFRRFIFILLTQITIASKLQLQSTIILRQLIFNRLNYNIIVVIPIVIQSANKTQVWASGTTTSMPTS